MDDKFCDSENSDDTCNLILWGYKLYNQAKINQNEALFKKIFDKYEKTTQALNTKDDIDRYEAADIFATWGDLLCDLAKTKQDETLFKEAIDKYAKAKELEPNNPWSFAGCGNALYSLAKMKKDEALFREAIDKYDEAIKLEHGDYRLFIQQGAAYVNLAEIKQDDNLAKEAEKCFKETKKDILDILVCLDNFDKTCIERTIKTKALHLLLDIDTDDSRFFREAVKNIPEEELNKYKEIYILSMFIISQLHVNNENEKSVAHYATKEASQKILFSNSKFRLNAINYSNDPTEGETLLNYLYKNNSAKKQLNKTHGAFAACFTFNHDSLNQFRLYGKEEKQEGTGLSLVFRNDFFSGELKTATKPIDKTKKSILSEFGLEDKNKDKNEKYPLFRCIYIDPVKQRVESVGQKEKYIFHREENEKAIEEYDGYISDVVKIVDKKMTKLRDLTKDLNPDVVGQLLINLRYLTKHIAFKEEQECRILRVRKLNDKGNLKDSKVEVENLNRIYIEYLEASSYVEKIYFGPKATGIELFQDILIYNGLGNIHCKKSENLLA